MAVLPASIAFLVAYGIAPGVLLAASAEARRCNVRPEQALLAGGWLDEEAYYASLARHLGLTFVAEPMTLADSAVFPQAILAGFAQLQVSAASRWQEGVAEASDTPA